MTIDATVLAISALFLLMLVSGLLNLFGAANWSDRLLGVSIALLCIAAIFATLFVIDI